MVHKHKYKQRSVTKIISIVWAEFQYVVSFYLSEKILSEAQLKFEESSHLHSITGSTYIT